MGQIAGVGIPRTKSRLVRLVALALTIIGSRFVVQAADEPLEYQVKAVFLLNFTRFIEWPEAAFASADSPVSICILGEDPFGETLDRVVAGEAVGGRSIVVRRIRATPPRKSCQVLFAKKIEKGEADLFRNPSVLGPGVLTVGEGAEFIHSGGVIAFILENRHVQFAINRGAAESAGLRLSARLLNVAKFVEKSP
jgi:hypothetical protein